MNTRAELVLESLKLDVKKVTDAKRKQHFTASEIAAMLLTLYVKTIADAVCNTDEEKAEFISRCAEEFST